MAFRHFHKHARTYTIIATIVMVFSLFTFSITTALQSYAGSMVGKVAGRQYFKFNTSSSYNINARERSNETDILSFRDLGLHKPGLGFVPWSTTTRAGDRLYGEVAKWAVSFVLK